MATRKLVRLGGKLKTAILGSTLFLVAVFSGCVGDGVDKEKGGNADDVDDTASNLNGAPVAGLRVLMDGSEIVIQDGAVEVSPGNVTLDASSSTDPDGDALSFLWTLDGETQTSNESSITAELDEGNHTANVTVGDGKNLTMAGVLIIVEAGQDSITGPVVGDGGVIHYLFEGEFAEGATEAQTHPFQVPAGSTQVTGWLSWDDGVFGNSPILVDLDIFVHNTEKEVAAVETIDYEFFRVNKTEDLAAAGEWKIDVFPFNVPEATAWKLDVFVWGGAPNQTVATGNKAGVNLGSLFGVSLPGTGNAADVTVTIPEGVNALTARLNWGSASGTSSSGPRFANDYDLVAKAGGAVQASSGNGFGGTEFLSKVSTEEDPILAGEWSFTVVSFAVPGVDYTLTIEYL